MLIYESFCFILFIIIIIIIINKVTLDFDFVTIFCNLLIWDGYKHTMYVDLCIVWIYINKRISKGYGNS